MASMNDSLTEARRVAAEREAEIAGHKKQIADLKAHQKQVRRP